MNRAIIINGFLFLFLPSLMMAGSSIDTLEKEVHQMTKKVDSFYHIVESNKVQHLYRFLDKYKNEEATLIKEWLVIASQKDEVAYINNFIEDSSFKMHSYLAHWYMKEKEPIGSRDYKVLKGKINTLLNENSKEKIGFLNHNYRAITDVNVRTMPIFSSLTNQKLILKKEGHFKLLYNIKYFKSDNTMTNWGYVELKGSKERGWVNLKNARRAK